MEDVILGNYGWRYTVRVFLHKILVLYNYMYIYVSVFNKLGAEEDFNQGSTAGINESGCMQIVAKTCSISRIGLVRFTRWLILFGHLAAFLQMIDFIFDKSLLESSKTQSKNALWSNYFRLNISLN